MSTKIFRVNKENFYSIFQKSLRNQIQELKGNIRVFCRIRPVIPEMDDSNDFVCKNSVEDLFKIHNIHKLEVAQVLQDEKKGAVYGTNYKTMNTMDKPQSFEFDAVFGHNSTQLDIFKEVNDLVISALDGYRVCIFAYGQTGSGKTYTMEGDFESQEHRGIIPRSIETIFKIIEKRQLEGWEFKIVCNFQEIY